MPPQVNPAGSCNTPVVIQSQDGVQEAKSCELEKKQSTDQKQEPKPTVPHRATAKEISHKKGEMAATCTTQQIKLNQKLNEKNKTESGKTKITESEQKMWDETVEKANAHIKSGIEKTQQIASNHAVRTQEVAKLHQREYRQDILKGEYFESEKITPGTTDKTKTTERVEDRSNGDVASRKYHQEQHRTSTQSGLQDRLKELNQGKELTQFEKGLVSKWNPQMKDGSITGLTPIMGVDSTGTKVPTEVQAYKVERGLETTYYDRNGNSIEPESRQQKVLKLDQRKHPQDMVRGELFEVENITPGSTNKTKTREHVDEINWKDINSRNFHPSQERTSTQSGLEDRLKELNPGKDLTTFEKGLVSEWNSKRDAKDPIVKLTPIMEIDTSGRKGPTEVQAYKLQRGINVTYYDRNGNDLATRSAHGSGQAIPTDSPIDYLTDAKIAKDLIMHAGEKVVEKFVTKETTSLGTRVETGAILNSVEKQAETGAVRTAGKQSAQAEVRTVQKQVASETEKAGVTNHYTTWRQGSGTTVHAEFTELEEKTIKEFEKDGMSRQEAEDVIRNTRGVENTVEVLKPDGPNGGGSTRSSWATHGAGKKTP